MSDPQIVRPRLAFEREFGQHRNWWVRDPRLAGNPLTVLLYLLSHDPNRMPTQGEARKELELGVAAWQSAKRRLIEAGFLVEIRDRFPRNFVDVDGRHRGAQKRYRLFIQDPVPGVAVTVDEAVIELDEPYEEYLKAVEDPGCGLSAPETKTPDRSGCGLSASPGADNPHPKDNPHPFKEEKTGWLVGLQDSLNQPTNQTVSAREVDAELEAVAPGYGLTVAGIARELGGRVDLSAIDLVWAAEETVGRARTPIRTSPAAYVAAVIARKPDAWPVGQRPAPWSPPSKSKAARDRDIEGAEACARGEHDWGPASWREIDRGHCVRGTCGQSRRGVDLAFAELEDELAALGGDR